MCIRDSLFGSVVFQELDIALPHRAHVHAGAVFQLHLEAAFGGMQRGKQPVGKRYVVKHEALRLTRQIQSRLMSFRCV